MLHFEIEPRVGYLYAAVSGPFDLSEAQSGYRGMLQAAQELLSWLGV